MSEKPRPYRLRPRWKITGTLTTRSPMHVGSGDTTTHPLLVNAKENNACNDVAAFARSATGPIIPATAIKGVLRSWADRCYPSQQDSIGRIFGTHEGGGLAEFHAAPLVRLKPDQLETFGKHLPYWRSDRSTAVMSHVGIHRQTGAAEDAKLYFEEFVPEGVCFSVEIEAERLAESEIGLLLGIFQHGAVDTIDGMQFGANGADGWGRVEWELGEVMRMEGAPAFDHDRCEFLSSWKSLTSNFDTVPAVEKDAKKPTVVSFELGLAFSGPFLVNDTSKAKPPNTDNSPLANFTALKRADGTVWLPASSFRGAFRSRFEFLAQSLGKPECITRVFGDVAHTARLRLTEFSQSNADAVLRHQDFVAIDRFTGGAADGAKFDALYADRPSFKSQVAVVTDGLEEDDLRLLAVTFRDLEHGRIAFGFGCSKGYGEAKGTLDAHGGQWLANLAPAAQASQPVLSAAAPMALATPSTPPAVAAENLKTGKLRRKVNKWVLEAPGKKGGTTEHHGIEAIIPPALKQDVGDTWDVEFQPGPDGKPKRVRKVGDSWPTGAGGEQTGLPSRFINPYYFLNLKERTDAFPQELRDRSPLHGTHSPHTKFLDGHYSGSLHIVLKTKTPLLLCDRPEDPRAAHKTYPVRVQGQKPLLASSSVRGMLRSAYESITNSRFGVFPFQLADGKSLSQGHARRLGFRLPARSGLNRIPVRIVRAGDQLEAELLPGTSTFDAQGQLTAGPVYAAWLGRYAHNAVTLPGGAPPHHRQEVWAYLAPYHYRRNNTEFDFWNVEALAPDGPMPPAQRPSGRCSSRNATRANWGTPGWHRGHVCVTLNNMTNKHDERFFFTTTPRVCVPLTADNVSRWADLIRDYQDQHRRQIEAGSARPSILTPPKVYSRQISVAPGEVNAAEIQLREGDLCYAEIATTPQGGRTIVHLYPVMISRKLYDRSPLDSLHKTLQPAKSIAELSPADRVFGWVSQDSATAETPAYRSQVRIGPVECRTEDAIDPTPVTLAILGQPKPAQGRFYLGNDQGKQQSPNLGKEQSGYSGRNRIRGPKVYPHHAQGVVPSNAIRVEQDSQNRTVKGLVKPGTEFGFTLRFNNLTAVELGALLWLLSLPEDHFLRLGLGKPLGFGSVHVRTESTLIADGAAWTRCIGAGRDPTTLPATEFIAKFEAAIKDANSTLLAAFKQAAKGFGEPPIQFPSLSPHRIAQINAERQGRGQGPLQDPTAIYHWFGQNDERGRLPLPDLEPGKVPSLPRDPS